MDIAYDIAFGGAFYAYCDVAQFKGLQLTSHSFRDLIDIGKRMKKKVMEDVHIEHPTEPDLSFLYGTVTAVNNEMRCDTCGSVNDQRT